MSGLAKELFDNIIENKRIRNLLILIILLLVFVGILIIQIMLQPPPVPEGVVRVVICQECDHKATMRVTDINDPKYICPKCGGKYKFAWKCRDCDYEFPYTSIDIEDLKGLEREDKFTKASGQRRCKNCNSLKTKPISE